MISWEHCTSDDGKSTSHGEVCIRITYEPAVLRANHSHASRETCTHLSMLSLRTVSIVYWLTLQGYVQYMQWLDCARASLGERVNHAVKTAFHYSSQLQTWSKTRSQAGRKHVENQLRTCLKRVFFSTFHLSSTRTNQRTCCGSRPGFRQKKSKAGRKRVANPHELVENLTANLVEKQVCSWLE